MELFQNFFFRGLLYKLIHLYTKFHVNITTNSRDLRGAELVPHTKSPFKNRVNTPYNHNEQSVGFVDREEQSDGLEGTIGWLMAVEVESYERISLSFPNYHTKISCM